ncbi:MAG: universal stress protein [Steroidobacteraceae bacterium]|jgi:nucleotide-binding universal stress UspA family protein|nr:universal stress protein [Steroidobacteraceae bacterium]
MTILCGTDFSAPAAEAARAAAALAGAWGEPLKLVHVIDLFEGDSLPPDAARALQEQRVQDLEVLAVSLRGATGATIECEVVRGIVDVELVQMATEAKARLVVVAALGQRSAPRWLVGSVAERMARATPVPLLLVRDAASLVEWAGGQRRLRVLAAIDQSESAKVALRWAARLEAPGGCELLVAQVVWPPAEHSRLGVAGPVALDRLDPAIEKRLEEDFRKWAADVPEAASARLVLAPAWGRADANVAMIGSIEGANAIVVGSHRRGPLERFLLGSVSAGVVHRADTNVFVVPATFEGAPAEAPVAELRTLLVPVDFSAPSDRALRQALAMAPAGGRVHLLHVLDPGRSPPEAEVVRTLQDAIPADAEERRVRVTSEVAIADDIATGIVQAAARIGADAICMSTHGRTGLARVLLGSQAEAVLRKATLPVMLVPMPRA